MCNSIAPGGNNDPTEAQWCPVEDTVHIVQWAYNTVDSPERTV